MLAAPHQCQDMGHTGLDQVRQQPREDAQRHHQRSQQRNHELVLAGDAADLLQMQCGSSPKNTRRVTSRM